MIIVNNVLWTNFIPRGKVEKKNEYLERRKKTVKTNKKKKVNLIIQKLNGVIRLWLERNAQMHTHRVEQLEHTAVWIVIMVKFAHIV